MDRVAVFCLLGLVLVGAHAQTVSPDQDGSPTTSPDASTTSTTTTSTTTAATSTTSSSTSTTETTSTTTPAPVTTAAPPSQDQFYRVTENNVTCIMFSGDMKFTITYPLKDKTKSNTTTIAVPRADDKNASVSSNGSCAPEQQYLVIQWGSSNTASTLKLLFNSTDEKWELVRTQASLFMDPVNFQNASDLGSVLLIDGSFPGLSNVAVDTNSSFTCRAQVESKNFSGKVESSDGKYEVTSSVVGLALEAYNSVPNVNTLQQGTRCEADITSDLVPIAVGCALAGLVLLVLISYLVGRRRRSAAYQSV